MFVKKNTTLIPHQIYVLVWTWLQVLKSCSVSLKSWPLVSSPQILRIWESARVTFYRSLPAFEVFRTWKPVLSLLSTFYRGLPKRWRIFDNFEFLGTWKKTFLLVQNPIIRKRIFELLKSQRLENPSLFRFTESYSQTKIFEVCKSSGLEQPPI